LRVRTGTDESVTARRFLPILLSKASGVRRQALGVRNTDQLPDGSLLFSDA
jgi:hypothetical protein